MEQKLNQLLEKIKADQGLAEKMFGLETPEEVQNLLKEQGLDFNLEEIGILRESIVNNLANEELSEDDLENVAGGIAATTVIAGVALGIEAAKFTHDVTRRRW